MEGGRDGGTWREEGRREDKQVRCHNEAGANSLFVC